MVFCYCMNLSLLMVQGMYFVHLKLNNNSCAMVIINQATPGSQ